MHRFIHCPKCIKKFLQPPCQSTTLHSASTSFFGLAKSLQVLIVGDRDLNPHKRCTFATGVAFGKAKVKLSAACDGSPRLCTWLLSAMHPELNGVTSVLLHACAGGCELVWQPALVRAAAAAGCYPAYQEPSPQDLRLTAVARRVRGSTKHRCCSGAVLPRHQGAWQVLSVLSQELPRIQPPSW